MTGLRGHDQYRQLVALRQDWLDQHRGIVVESACYVAIGLSLRTFQISEFSGRPRTAWPKLQSRSLFYTDIRCGFPATHLGSVGELVCSLPSHSIAGDTFAERVRSFRGLASFKAF